MMFLLYTVHVLICFFLIAVVLLQQGKGADLSVFGGGATQTAFGARGAASVLHRLTVGSFVAFILTTLAIGVVQSNLASSVIQGLPEETIEETVPAEPEGALPTEEATEGTDGEIGDGEVAETTGDETTGDGEASDTPAEDTGDGEASDAPAEDPGDSSSEVSTDQADGSDESGS